MIIYRFLNSENSDTYLKWFHNLWTLVLFLLVYLIIFCVFCLFVSASYACSPSGDHKRTSYFLKTEIIAKIVSLPVKAGYQAQVLCKNSKFSELLSCL